MYNTGLSSSTPTVTWFSFKLLTHTEKVTSCVKIICHISSISNYRLTSTKLFKILFTCTYWQEMNAQIYPMNVKYENVNWRWKISALWYYRKQYITTKYTYNTTSVAPVCVKSSHTVPVPDSSDTSTSSRQMYALNCGWLTTRSQQATMIIYNNINMALIYITKTDFIQISVYMMLSCPTVVTNYARQERLHIQYSTSSTFFLFNLKDWSQQFC